MIEEKPGLCRAAVGFVRVLEGKPGLGRAAVSLFALLRKSPVLAVPRLACLCD